MDTKDKRKKVTGYLTTFLNKYKGGLSPFYQEPREIAIEP